MDSGVDEMDLVDDVDAVRGPSWSKLVKPKNGGGRRCGLLKRDALVCDRDGRAPRDRGQSGAPGGCFA